MVREFQPRDMERVLDIWLAASILAHDFVPGGFWESKVADMRDVYLPSSELHVHEDDGAVDGFIALREGVVEALFVAPDRQGRGIGGKLMAQAKALSADLRLTVYKENAGALRFYGRCGFTVAREQIDGHTGRPELLLVYP